MSRVRPALTVLAVAGLFLSACDATRTVAPVEMAPVASTPAGAVQRLGWAFNHRDIGMVAGLLSDDFVFQTAELDSAGGTARDALVTRDSLLAALRSLFEGVPGVSRPASVRVSLDPNLLPFPDTRPGRDPRMHQTVRTSFDLVVDDSTSQGSWEVTGHALFFLTRGDSAAIPADQVALGAHADSTRWWIDRWEDETIGSAGAGSAHTNPARRMTLWAVLRFYLDRLRPQPLVTERSP